MGKGDVCALTVQYTHIKPHTEANSISAHTHTHTQRREGGASEVAGQGDRVRWGQGWRDKGTGTRC